MAKFVIENGVNKGKEYRVQSDGTLVSGRESSASLRISDSLASRQHFKIEVRNSDLFIVDLKSTNGTYVNGKRVSEAKLHVGDRIKVGETMISLLPDEESDAAGGLIGRVIAGYRLERRLGRGGMGTVYKATQVSLNRPVALKILSDDLARNQQFISMFISEARAAAMLQHPNIVLAYDVGKDGDYYYFSMEFVAGGSLQELLSRRKRLTVSEAIKYAIEAARGLEFAERKGIVHRDIKPDNLMITEDDSIKICDLGLARSYLETDEQKRTEGVAGSPHYIAPEQALNRQVDHRADIYSLGATVYRMLAGTTPFSGSSVKELLKKHITEKPPNLTDVNGNVPQVLSHVVEKMMAKDPEDRYQSAHEVIEDLTAIGSLDFGVELAEEKAEEKTGERAKTPASLEIDTEVPVLLEEVKPSPAPTTVPLPPSPELKERKPFPKVKAAIIALVVIALGAAGYFGYGLVNRLSAQWAVSAAEKDIKKISDEILPLEEVKLRSALQGLPGNADTLKAVTRATEELRQIADKRRDNADVQRAVQEKISLIQNALLKRASGLGQDADYKGAAEVCDAAKQVFAGDGAYVARVDATLASITREKNAADARKKLGDLITDALEIERKWGQQLGHVSEVHTAFKSVLDERQRTLAILPNLPPYLEARYASAVEKEKEYAAGLKEIENIKAYNDSVSKIKALISSGQYVEARAALAKLQTDFPFIVARDTNLPAADSIDGAAMQEYNIRLLSDVNRGIQDAKFDAATRKFDTFDATLRKLEDFQRRFGPGKLSDDAEKLAKEMERVQNERARIQTLLDQNKRQEALVAANKLADSIEYPPLRSLAEKCANDVRRLASGPDVQGILARFDQLAKRVEDAINDFDFVKAQDEIKAFPPADVIPEIRADFDELKQRASALAAAQIAVIDGLNAAVEGGARIAIDESGRALASAGLDGILLEGMTTPIPWDGLGSAELGELFTAAGRPASEAERYGLALVCLQRGEDLRMFRIGLELMNSLTDSANYAAKLGRYKADMKPKVETARAKLIEEYFNEQDKAKKEKLGAAVKELDKFLTDNFS